MDRLRALWRERRDMLAGLLDAGFASLATFAIGIYAVRVLDPTALGGYALAYQAIFLVGIIPANLVFVPVEIRVVEHPPAHRLGHLRRALVLGTGPSLLSALAILLWIPIAPPEIPSTAVVALTVTAIATAALSPMQDHVRRMLHSGGESWTAATVSGAQLAASGAALAFLHFSEVHPTWIPFGALAIANACSLLVGLVGARRVARPIDAEAPEYRFLELARAGSWLVGGGLLNPATGFVSAALVSRLASAAALGYAEAARVVAQPVWVLAVGISSVLGPRSMEAAQAGRQDQAKSVRRGYLLPVLGFGALNLAWFGSDWVLNPLSWLLPAAYAVPWLVAASILAQVLSATIFPYRSELLGARKEATYTRIEVVASVVRTAVSASASILRAFAIPLGVLAVWIVRWFAIRRALVPIYREERGSVERGSAEAEGAESGSDESGRVPPPE